MYIIIISFGAVVTDQGMDDNSYFVTSSQKEWIKSISNENRPPRMHTCLLVNDIMKRWWKSVSERAAAVPVLL